MAIAGTGESGSALHILFTRAGCDPGDDRGRRTPMREDCMEPARIARLPLFAELDDEQRAEIADCVREVEVAEGATLTTQGANAYEFFVIEAGQAEVRRDGEVIGSLQPGDVCGEIGLLVTGTGTASVVAVTPMGSSRCSRASSSGSRTACLVSLTPCVRRCASGSSRRRFTADARDGGQTAERRSNLARRWRSHWLAKSRTHRHPPGRRFASAWQECGRRPRAAPSASLERERACAGRRPRELRQLVEEQHAVVGQRAGMSLERVTALRVAGLLLVEHKSQLRRAQRSASSNRGSSRTAAKSSSLRASSRNRGSSSTDRRRWANVSSPVSPASVAKHA